MKEFKFNCPACGQRILAPADSSGRKINCPSCKGPITIPSGPTESKKPAAKPATVAPPGSPPQLKISGQGSATAPPKKTPPPAGPASSPVSRPAQSAETSPVVKPKPAPTATEQPEKPDQLRLSDLTPAIRLEMVRAVRKRIANESNWLPAKIEGDLAYAAKDQDGKSVVVDVKSPEATRFSLIGAFQKEFQLRKVVGTAVGRREILDEEIPAAIREVLLGKMTESEREQAEDPLANKDRAPLTHAQCHAALDVLEKRYSEQKEQLRDNKAKRKLGTVRLSDLVPKLEQKARILPEEVATALYHELMDVRKRLEKLEGRSNPEK